MKRALLFSLCICALANGQLETSATFPHEKSDLTPDPRVTWGRLDNGFRYAILPHPIPNDRVSLYLTVQVGSFYELEDERGYAHFVEHMLFNGTERYPGFSAMRALEQLGLSFGTHSNATTGYFETSYFISELPCQDPTAAQTGLAILSDFAGFARFEKGEVRSEKKIVVNELLHNSNVLRRFGEDPLNPLDHGIDSFYQNELEGLFDETLLERRRPDGQVKVVKRANAASLRSFYQRWYRPERMTLAVVGDVDPVEIEDWIRTAFSRLQPRDEALPPLPSPRPHIATGPPPRLFARGPILATRAQVSIANAVCSDESDTLASRRAALGQTLALEAVAETLKTSSTISASVELGVQHLVPGWRLPYLRTFCPAEDIALTALELDATMSGALRNGLDAKSFAEVRKRIRRDVQVQASAMRNARSRFLAEALATSTARDRVFMAPDESLALYHEWLADIDAEEAQSALRDIWPLESSQVIVTGPLSRNAVYGSDLALRLADQRAAAASPVAELAGSGQPEAESDSAATEEEALIETGEPAAVRAQAYNELLDTTVVDFENGVRLIAKPTEYRKDWVNFEIRFGYGTLGTKDASHALVGALLLVGGSEALAPRKAKGYSGTTSLSFNNALDSFEIAFGCSPDEVDAHLQLISLLFTKPRYDEGGRQLLNTAFSSANRDFTETVLHELRRVATQSHFTSRDWKLEESNALSPQDFAEWLNPQLANSPLQITAVGDFDLSRLTTAASETFGRFPKRTNYELPSEDRLIQTPQGAISRTLAIEGKRRTEMVAIGWPLEDEPGSRDDVLLDLLVRVLRLRLDQKIREEKGLSYSPSSLCAQLTGLEPATVLFQIYTKTSPKRGKRTLREMRRMIEELRAKGIPQDEFNTVLEQSRHYRAAQLKNNNSWLELLGISRGDFEYPESFATADRWHATLTAADLTAYLRAKLRHDRSIELRTTR